MAFEPWIAGAWNDHGTAPDAVWGRLADALPLLGTPQHLFRLAHLAAHVAGEHLGRWDDGERFLEGLTAAALFDPAGAEGKGVRRLQAALHYCAGRADRAEEELARAVPAGGRAESVRVRMLAVAASALAHHGRWDEAFAAFDEALALAGYGPERGDPAAADLASTGNNLACELESQPSLDQTGRARLLRAATAARKYWEIAGTWREVERAEYRLAMSHLAAGLAEEALPHALECLRISEQSGGDPGELFFAREAIAKVQARRGDLAAARAERDAAAALVASVADPGFRAFCEGELAKLQSAIG